MWLCYANFKTTVSTTSSAFGKTRQRVYYPSGVKVEKIRSIKVYDEDDNEIPCEYDRERIDELELYLN